ncbi:MAG: DUF4129 domain-containing protein, partial [Acidimicrobiales bacterium]
MDRRAAMAVLTGTLVAVLFAAVATGGEVEFADGAPSFVSESAPAEPRTITPAIATETGIEPRAPLELPAIVELIARLVFYGCLIVFAVALAVFAWRYRPRLRWPRRRRRPPTDFDVLDDVAASVTADADAQLAALHRGAPRNAIVECWIRLEGAVIAAGVDRVPADTSAELTQRVLSTHQVDRAAISALAALYREARFSEHPMGEESRLAAIRALDAVHDGLRSELDA